MIVPVFFVASLASRAASLRLAEGVEAVGKTSVPWFSLGGVLAGVVVALGTAAAFLGGQGGLLERLGRIIPLALSSIILGLTFVVAQILKPVGWVTDHWTISGITQWRSDIRVCRESTQTLVNRPVSGTNPIRPVPVDSPAP